MGGRGDAWWYVLNPVWNLSGRERVSVWFEANNAILSDILKQYEGARIVAASVHLVIHSSFFEGDCFPWSFLPRFSYTG